MTRTLVVLCAFMLAGCGTAEKIDARTQYQQAVADYRVCLDANPSDPRACDGKRLSMEVEERVYNNLSAGAQDGNTTTNLNIQSR
jgi:hypothetical protein